MKKLMVLALVLPMLAACSTTEVNCPEAFVLEQGQVAGLVPMPAPAPKPAPPRPPAPKPAAPKAPAPAGPAKAPPAPAAPKPQVQRPAPKPYKPPPIYRPTDRNRPMTYGNPGYNYRNVYVTHQTDHTPLLWMLAMNGAMSNHNPQPVECQ